MNYAVQVIEDFSYCNTGNNILSLSIEQVMIYFPLCRYSTGNYTLSYSMYTVVSVIIHFPMDIYKLILFHWV
jgi:hypothetical protein